MIVKAVTDLPEQVSSPDRRCAEAHLIELAGEYGAKTLKVLGRKMVLGRKIFEVIDPEAAERYEGEKLAKEEREAAPHRADWTTTRAATPTAPP